MRNPQPAVKPWCEPALFRASAAAVTLQALVDHDDHTVVFSVTTLNPVTEKLEALWSSSPISLDRYLKQMHEAHSEFLSQLWNASGPFAE